MTCHKKIFIFKNEYHAVDCIHIYLGKTAQVARQGHMRLVQNQLYFCAQQFKNLTVFPRQLLLDLTVEIERLDCSNIH